MRLFSAYDTEIKNSMNENGVIISLNKRILDDTLIPQDILSGQRFRICR